MSSAVSITDLAYADGIALLGDSFDTVEEALDRAEYYDMAVVTLTAREAAIILVGIGRPPMR